VLDIEIMINLWLSKVMSSGVRQYVSLQGKDVSICFHITLNEH